MIVSVLAVEQKANKCLSPKRVGRFDDESTTEQVRFMLGLGRREKAQRNPLVGGLRCGRVEGPAHLTRGLLRPLFFLLDTFFLIAGGLHSVTGGNETVYTKHQELKQASKQTP